MKPLRNERRKLAIPRYSLAYGIVAIMGEAVRMNYNEIVLRDAAGVPR